MNTIRTIIKAAKSLKLASTNALRNEQITLEQLDILATIHSYKTISSLALHLHKDPNAISKEIDKLQKLGYILKSKNRSDHRYLNIEITSLGAEKLNSALRAIEALEERIKSTIESQSELKSMLERITKAVL